MKRLAALFLLACGGHDLTSIATDEPPSNPTPDGKGIGTLVYAPVARVSAPNGEGLTADAGHLPAQNGIDFHGGPVMTSPVKLYFIWYGNWAGNTATKILSDWGAGIGATPYFAINATYTSASKVPVTKSVAMGAQITDAYSQGSKLADASVAQIVVAALGAKKLPVDPNGVYFVLTSKDVSEGNFCTQFCGWHTFMTYQKQNLRYSFVGSADRCPNACSVQSTSPNGNAGADAMASVMAHELSETVTDPELNAWFDKSGMENGDKCAWTFGPVQLSNGAKYNVSFGGRKWLLQQNWVNASGGKCALAP